MDPAARRSYALTGLIVAVNIAGVMTIQVLRHNAMTTAIHQRAEIVETIKARCGL